MLGIASSVTDSTATAGTRILASRQTMSGLSVIRRRHAGASFPADMRRRVTRRNSARPTCMAPYRPRLKGPSACEAEAMSEARRNCWSNRTNWTQFEGLHHAIRAAWRMHSG
jgi:hypothetical protein